jgi:hypothetical protein
MESLPWVLDLNIVKLVSVGTLAAFGLEGFCYALRWPIPSSLVLGGFAVSLVLSMIFPYDIKSQIAFGVIGLLAGGVLRLSRIKYWY